jgi:hypothetical protein
LRNPFAIAAQFPRSLRIRFAIIAHRFVIALQSVFDCFAIGVQSRLGRFVIVAHQFVIALQLLRDHSAFALQSSRIGS